MPEIELDVLASGCVANSLWPAAIYPCLSPILTTSSGSSATATTGMTNECHSYGLGRFYRLQTYDIHDAIIRNSNQDPEVATTYQLLAAQTLISNSLTWSR